MKASQMYSHFDITVSSHHTESLNTIESMSQVKGVEILDSCRYHVITKRDQRPSLFKRQLPNITQICKYNVVKKIVPETIVSDDYSTDDDEEDEYKQYVRSLYKPVDSTYGMAAQYRSWRKEERLSDARFRREFAQNIASSMLGISVNTPDDTPSIPSKIFWKKEPVSFEGWFQSYPSQRPEGYIENFSPMDVLVRQARKIVNKY